MEELLDNSELTLELIHILELIDNPVNSGKVLGMCIGLQHKLDRFRESIRLIPEAQLPFDPQAALVAEQEVEQKIIIMKTKIDNYRTRLIELKKL